MGYSRPSTTDISRTREIRRVLWWVLLLNVGVATAKLGYGFFIDSVSITADGFHSLFDGTSNIIGLVGLGLAARPADRGHPYGHGKYETFASAAIGALLLFAAWRVGSSAFARLQDPGTGPAVDATSFAVMLVTLAINLVVTTLERRVGKRMGSELLKADASHTASDVLVTLGVIGGLAAVRLGYPIADPILGLLVAVFIVVTAFRVLASAGGSLADTARLDPAEVSARALEVDGVLGCHDVRTRGSESEVYVDVHVQVDPAISVARGHAIAERVEQAIVEGFPEVVDAIAHLEPLDEYQRQKTAEQERSGLL
ncbi:MAG: cation transporter [Coriobacteriia bacterium]|nr:cation transporter [Coriobacteriia bacterium]MBN2841384.1 cation transporter [Coriobacteriia bacterium]